MPHVLGLSPQVVALLGSLVVLTTALHATLLALGGVLHVVSAWLPQTTRPARALVALGRFVGVAAVDVDKLGAYARRAAAWAVVRVGSASIVALVALIACTPAEIAVARTAMSTLDALASVVPRIVSGCDALHADVVHVARARAALATHDYATAIVESRAIVDSARSTGVAIPAELEESLALAEGALAATAIQNGMRAISVDGGNASNAK